MSDLSQAIAGLLQAADFTADTRLYALDTPFGTDRLLVESFVGKDELSALYAYHVTCLSTDAHIELKRLLGQQVTLRTRLADGTHSARSGYVAAVAHLGADGGVARYRLTLVPWLWMATQRRTSRVFQDRSVLDILDAVLAHARLRLRYPWQQEERNTGWVRDDYVHDSHAGFALDSTHAIDPRILYQGGDERVYFAQTGDDGEVQQVA